MEMEGSSRNEEACPQLIDLIPKNRAWFVKSEEKINHKFSEEKKLELRLAPPGEDWSAKINSTTKNNKEKDNQSLLSLGYFSSMNTTINGAQNQNFLGPFSSSYHGKNQQQTKASSFLLPVAAKESSQQQPKAVMDLQNAEKKKAFSPPAPVATANTSVPNSSQKRTAPASVVGWPPIRSFRKNLASSSSSKPISETQNVVPSKVGNESPVESGRKGLFVKINMDGVPIGRKVDLNAYDSYEKLSTAVDELFRGLLAVQRDSLAGGIQNKQEEEKAIKGVLDGSGEHTLVYEDNEGDRILVGDVPWHMFVSTVKRLRVLKSSELSTLSLGSSKQGKRPA